MAMYTQAVQENGQATRRVRRKKRGCGLRLLNFLLLAAVLALGWQVWKVYHPWEGGEVPSAEPLTDWTETPLPTLGPSEELVDALEARAREDRRYKPFARHPEDYPEGLLRQVLRSEEVLDFALAYPENVTKTWRPEDIALEQPTGIPHYIQWDARWGYGAYGSSTVGVSGCGPTCLSMAVVGLTGNTGANPLAVAEYSASQGWYVPGSGTDWELLRSGAEHFGLSWQELGPEAEELYRILDAGGCVMASMLPGDFTASGHFILISGYTAEGFQVLDPNSERLSRVWTLEDLKPQFAALWGYTA